MSEIKTETTTEIKTESAPTVKDFSYTTVKSPLFVLFAEYLGFVSNLAILEWCEKWCEGKEPKETERKVIETEAVCLLHQVQTVYTDDEITNWYNEFYDVILKNYDEKLAELEKKKRKSPCYRLR